MVAIFFTHRLNPVYFEELIMLNWLKGLSIAAVCALSISVQAAPIVDVVDVDARVTLFTPAVWTHDLSDTDFVLGTAESATLSIEFWDPRSTFLDWATIIVGTIDFLDGEFVYKPVSDWSGSLGLSSLASLNALGQLQVSVSTLFGDFNVGSSTLSVVTASVPESSSLMLFALGLLGLVALRRKNAA
jgi:hypothetical protein